MLGKLDEYVAEKESFTNYVERIEQFFEPNAIAVGKQKAVFLATCGASTYETLKNLCLPSEVKNVSYSEIIQKLTTHYAPEPLLIYERYIFGKRTRKYEDKVADFAVDLKRLSSTCKFDAFLDQALCMQFVVGLNMLKVQSRLVQERTLAFDDAVKIAIAPLPHARTSMRCAAGVARKMEQSIECSRRGAGRPKQRVLAMRERWTQSGQLSFPDSGVSPMQTDRTH